MEIRSLMSRPCLIALVLGAATAGLAASQMPAESGPPPASPSPTGPAGAKVHPRHSRVQGLAPAGQERLDRLAAELGLSDIQKGQVKELMILERRAHGRQDGSDRHSGQAGRSRDRGVDRHDRDRGNPAISRREFRHELKGVLTPEQFSKFKALRKADRQAPAAPGAAPSSSPEKP
ncbi:MAG: hypothetical protein ABSA05_09525 [Opitutaceae bacterium]|jgi:Spy/CpxP family protein refolding chaperone